MTSYCLLAMSTIIAHLHQNVWRLKPLQNADLPLNTFEASSKNCFENLSESELHLGFSAQPAALKHVTTRS